jgi:hypothetical protein
VADWATVLNIFRQSHCWSCSIYDIRLKGPYRVLCKTNGSVGIFKTAFSMHILSNVVVINRHTSSDRGELHMSGNRSLRVNVSLHGPVSMMRRGCATAKHFFRKNTKRRREMCFACPPRHRMDGEQSDCG